MSETKKRTLVLSTNERTEQLIQHFSEYMNISPNNVIRFAVRIGLDTMNGDIDNDKLADKMEYRMISPYHPEHIE